MAAMGYYTYNPGLGTIPVHPMGGAPMQGQGPFGDFVRKGARFVKDKKLISNALGAASGFMPQYAPVLGTAASLASALGFGGKKKRRKAKKGGAKKKSKGKKKK